MLTDEQIESRRKWIEVQNEYRLKFIDGVISRIAAGVFFLTIWFWIVVIVTQWVWQ